MTTPPSPPSSPRKSRHARSLKEEPHDAQIFVSQMSVSPGDVGGAMSTITFHAASGRPTSPKPHVQNSAERRASHNAVERQRRETLNARFLDLAAMLPSLATIRKPTKSAIVNTSIAHVNASSRHRALATQQLRLVQEDARAGIARIPTPARGEAFEMLVSGAEPEMDEMYWRDVDGRIGMEEEGDEYGDGGYSHSPEEMPVHHSRRQRPHHPHPYAHPEPRFAHHPPPLCHPYGYDEEQYLVSAAPPIDIHHPQPYRPQSQRAPDLEPEQGRHIAITRRSFDTPTPRDQRRRSQPPPLLPAISIPSAGMAVGPASASTDGAYHGYPRQLAPRPPYDEQQQQQWAYRDDSTTTAEPNPVGRGKLFNLRCPGSAHRSRRASSLPATPTPATDPPPTRHQPALTRCREMDDQDWKSYRAPSPAGATLLEPITTRETSVTQHCFETTSSSDPPHFFFDNDTSTFSIPMDPGTGNLDSTASPDALSNTAVDTATPEAEKKKRNRLCGAEKRKRQKLRAREEAARAKDTSVSLPNTSTPPALLSVASVVHTSPYPAPSENDHPRTPGASPCIASIMTVADIPRYTPPHARRRSLSPSEAEYSIADSQPPLPPSEWPDHIREFVYGRNPPPYARPGYRDEPVLALVDDDDLGPLHAMLERVPTSWADDVPDVVPIASVMATLPPRDLSALRGPNPWRGIRRRQRRMRANRVWVPTTPTPAALPATPPLDVPVHNISDACSGTARASAPRNILLDAPTLRAHPVDPVVDIPYAPLPPPSLCPFPDEHIPPPFPAATRYGDVNSALPFACVLALPPPRESVDTIASVVWPFPAADGSTTFAPGAPLEAIRGLRPDLLVFAAAVAQMVHLEEACAWAFRDGLCRLVEAAADEMDRVVDVLAHGRGHEAVPGVLALLVTPLGGGYL
ncbi:Macrophage erythroblast attacher isoform 1 [Mycena kentingensis (nom. inval.)]|nr:Macrophage erythroblast attacher isoform 1 [Mycena kentingensis (nom. inval.)]